jgi:hypothetical protein
MLLIALLIPPVISANDENITRTAGLQGTVIDTLTGQPLSWTTLELVGTQRRLKADASGRFEFADLAPDSYSLRVSRVGYESKILTNVTLAPNQITQITVELTLKEITVKSIVVSPGSYSIMGEEPTVHQTLARGEIATVPQLGDDFFRSVMRLPGMSGNDYTTRFDIRGGEYEEVLVTLDGLEIYEPFHMKDFDGGCVSVIDVAAIEGVDMMTGGFPARYGERMSGVFNIRSRNVSPGQSRVSAGFSITNLRALTEGTFRSGRGSWLVSARRGSMGLILKLLGEEQIRPSFYDCFGKISYRIGGSQILSLDFLHAHDNLSLLGQGGDSGDTLHSNYGNSYAWINLYSLISRKLTARSVASLGRLTHDRRGQLYDPDPNTGGTVNSKISERETARIIGLKTDWQYEASDRLLFEFGLASQALRADYDYLGRRFNYAYEWFDNRWNPVVRSIDTSRVDFEPSGRKFGAYISSRIQLSEPITAEVGLRYDKASHTGDDLLSSRAGLVYRATPQTSLRMAVGEYYQIEGIHEVAVTDGESQFYPAQKAVHYVAGYEHQFPSGTKFRAESYYKKYSHLRPSHRNYLSQIEEFPQYQRDRQTVYCEGTTAKGIEVYLTRDVGSEFSWFLSYSYARVEDSVSSAYFPGIATEIAYDQTMPSPRDIRGTLYLDLIYRPGKAWQINIALQYHSGWPLTSLHLERVEVQPGEYVDYVVPDDYGAARFEPFQRLDLRINKFFRIGQGKLNCFTEVLNATNRNNVRSYTYRIVSAGNQAIVRMQPDEKWFGIMPSLGVSYEVEF